MLGAEQHYQALWTVELGLVLAVGFVFYTAYASATIPHPLAWAAVIVPALFAKRLLKAGAGTRRLRQLANYQRERLRRLEGEWRGSEEAAFNPSEPDHPYAADLDLFGQGSLYEYLSTARTGFGRQTLGQWLLDGVAVEQTRARQTAVQELRDRHDLREYFAISGSMQASAKDTLDDCRALMDWLSSPPRPFGAGARILALLICLLTLASAPLAILGWVGHFVPLLLLGGVAAITVAFHDRVSAIQQGIVRQAPRPELHRLAAFATRLQSERFSSPLLTSLQAHFEHRPAAIKRLVLTLRLLQLHEDPAFTYISYLSLWGVQFAMAVEGQRTRHREMLISLTAAIGALEALLSLSAYAFEHPEYPFPDLVDCETPVFEASALGHPLLSAVSCVRNVADLNAATRFILVSGSNMSGKSTYLRSIGLNTVLARAGAPVCADNLRLSHFQLATSMRVQDSLQEGKSRFFAEVSRVRAVLDLAERGPVLFLLDELLSGTNSQDRRDGVAGVIEHLIAHRASGLLTTHDLALTGIVSYHGNSAANVHFTDVFEDGKMSFDYKLRPGVVNRANAREILGLLGIPVHALRTHADDRDLV
ncbi:MAG TPA: hypothetical protein VHZ07_11830 [Bryobacteraceae bacterium]|nr:hypothetical protein [Bryobacteraceae bacterium]